MKVNITKLKNCTDKIKDIKCLFRYFPDSSDLTKAIKVLIK